MALPRPKHKRIKVSYSTVYVPLTKFIGCTLPDLSQRQKGKFMKLSQRCKYANNSKNTQRERESEKETKRNNCNEEQKLKMIDLPKRVSAAKRAVAIQFRAHKTQEAKRKKKNSSNGIHSQSTINSSAFKQKKTFFFSDVAHSRMPDSFGTLYSWQYTCNSITR